MRRGLLDMDIQKRALLLDEMQALVRFRLAGYQRAYMLIEQSQQRLKQSQDRLRRPINRPRRFADLVSLADPAQPTAHRIKD